MDTKQRATILGLEALIALALVFAILATFAAINRAFAQQANFTDQNGHYSGSAFTHGNTTSFQNSNGQFTGSSITHGNTTNFYDGRGHFTGSVTRQGTASNPLSPGRR